METCPPPRPLNLKARRLGLASRAFGAEAPLSRERDTELEGPQGLAVLVLVFLAGIL